MKTKVTDQLICELTKEWVATLPDRYPLNREEPHQFSRRFLDRMEPILEAARKAEREEKRARRLTTKATAAILAALLGASVAMAYAVHYFRMVQMKYEKYSTVDYERVGEGDGWEEFVPYHITYVPEGFTQIQSRLTEISYQEKYKNDEGLIISFYQERIGEATFFIDTENMESKAILLNEKQSAFLMEYENYKSIYWNDGEYSFLISGKIDENILVKIAKSTNKQ